MKNVFSNFLVSLSLLISSLAYAENLVEGNIEIKDGEKANWGYVLGKIKEVSKSNVIVAAANDEFDIMTSKCTKLDKLKVGDKVLSGYAVMYPTSKATGNQQRVNIGVYILKANSKQHFNSNADVKTDGEFLLPKMYYDRNLKELDDKFVSSFNSGKCFE